MIHYNFWFSFKPDVVEPDGLAIIEAFLAELQAAGSLAGFQLLRNTARGQKTHLPDFQALIAFRDSEQFSTTFSTQRTEGIHHGRHGQVMALVGNFRVEVFEQIGGAGSTQR